MFDLKFDHDVAQYDRYKAKHIHISRSTQYSEHSPLVLFDTGQAAMKLTDHEAVHMPAKMGADPDIILRCKTWQDMPEAQLSMLMHYGARKVTRLYSHLQAVG